MCFSAKKTCKLRLQPPIKFSVKLIPNIYLDYNEESYKLEPRKKPITQALTVEKRDEIMEREQQLMKREEQEQNEYLEEQIKLQEMERRRLEELMKTKKELIESIKKTEIMTQIDNTIIRILKNKDDEKFRILKDYKFQFMSQEELAALLTGQANIADNTEREKDFMGDEEINDGPIKTQQSQR